MLQLAKISHLHKFLLLLLMIGANIYLTSCGLDQKGMVLFLDPSYKAQVIGTDIDGFTVPDGILWREGDLYIADEGGPAFRIWSAPGRSVTLADSGDGVLSPEDIAVDALGNIYFTDDDSGGVWRIDSLGEATQLVGKDQGIVSSEGIVLAPDGNLLIGDGEAHKVFQVTPSGQVSVYLGSEYGIEKPESMVFDNQGNLYIADNDAKIVYLLTPEKVLHRLLKDREDFSPETLWYSDEVLYITDSENGKLFKYTSKDDLEALAVFGGQLSKVHGVTTDDTGAVYVSIQSDLRKKKGYILKIERSY